MSIRLKNRRSVEEKLHKFLDNASVLPQVASNIVSPHINEDFLEAVVTLSQRLKYLEQTTPPKDGSSVDIAPVDTRYGRTILPELERLKVKAVGKIRDYFTNQINGIRKPKSNIQILQQNSLVKYAKLFSFLQHESPAVAEELRLIVTPTTTLLLLLLLLLYFTTNTTYYYTYTYYYHHYNGKYYYNYYCYHYNYYLRGTPLLLLLPQLLHYFFKMRAS